MIKKDSYISWKELNGQRVVLIHCSKCNDVEKDGVLWPHVWGYGDLPINCCKCGEVIYSGKQKANKTES